MREIQTKICLKWYFEISNWICSSPVPNSDPNDFVRCRAYVQTTAAANGRFVENHFIIKRVQSKKLTSFFFTITKRTLYFVYSLSETCQDYLSLLTKLRKELRHNII